MKWIIIMTLSLSALGMQGQNVEYCELYGVHNLTTKKNKAVPLIEVSIDNGTGDAESLGAYASMMEPLNNLAEDGWKVIDRYTFEQEGYPIFIYRYLLEKEL